MAKWFEVKRESEAPTMWAPPGGPYLINVNHPLMREEYEQAKRAFGVPHIYPMDDMLRRVWELDIIQRYHDQEEMPAHVIYRLKVPPYKELWKTTPSTAIRRSPSLDEGGEDVGIKKDRRGGNLSGQEDGYPQTR